jgi:CRP/FNR family transcriptional regulator, cyclic AMP receptor protein
MKAMNLQNEPEALASPLFDIQLGLSESLLSYGKPKHYPAETVIYPTESISNEMYYLIKGQVKQLILTVNGVEKILGWVKPGCLFGEAMFFIGCPSQTSVVAVEDSLIYVFSRKSVEEMFNQHPHLLYEVAKSLSYKIRLLTSHIWVMTSSEPDIRIGKLLDLFTRNNSETNPVISITHQALADLAGIHRVTASKVLSNMRQKGILECQRGQIIVMQRKALMR